MIKVVVTDARASMAKQVDGKEEALPKPYKAAEAPALAFLCGSVVPLVAAIAISQHRTRIVIIMVVTTILWRCWGTWSPSWWFTHKIIFNESSNRRMDIYVHHIWLD